MTPKKLKLEDRIHRLENSIKEFQITMVDLKESVEKLLGTRTQGYFDSVPTGSGNARERISHAIQISDRIPNPWAIDAAMSLMNSRFIRNAVNKSYETYRPTIEALRNKSDWTSAEEVGELTHRERNTASTYLNRLFNAQLVEKKRHGRKVYYRLRDEKKLKRVFGQRARRG